MLAELVMFLADGASTTTFCPDAPTKMQVCVVLDMVVTSLGEICKGVDLINPEIHDPFRSVIYPLIDNGSVAAWKALGAGGGGCSAILCSPFGLDTANKALRNAGWKIIDWDFEDVGVVLEK